MKCLTCGLEAKIEGTYKGIEIRECPVGHRTGFINSDGAYLEGRTEVLDVDFI